MITKLGKYLRKARIEMGVNMSHMAEAVKISPALLSAIETGRRDIKDDVIGRLADYLKLSESEREQFEQIAFGSNSELSIRLDRNNEPQTEALALLARHIGDLSQDGYAELSRLVSKHVKRAG